MNIISLYVDFKQNPLTQYCTQRNVITLQNFTRL